MKEDDIIRPTLSRLFSIFSTKVYSMCFTGVGLNELNHFIKNVSFEDILLKKDNLSKFVPLFSIKTTNKSCIKLC